MTPDLVKDSKDPPTTANFVLLDIKHKLSAFPLDYQNELVAGLVFAFIILI